jgi:hypothetical protein
MDQTHASLSSAARLCVGVAMNDKYLFKLYWKVVNPC